MSRIEKVNQQVKREVGLIIQQELSDPRLEFVTINKVDVSKDLKNARIYFSVLGQENEIKNAENAFRSAAGAIRRFLAKRLDLRFTPNLLFSYDDSIQFSAKIDETLREVNREHEENSSDN